MGCYCSSTFKDILFSYSLRVQRNAAGYRDFKNTGAEKVTNDAIFTILLQGSLLTWIAEVTLAESVTHLQPHIS